MRLFLDDDHDVARLNPRILVGFPVESVLLLVGGTLVDFDLDHLFFFAHLFAIARLALVLLIDDFALASTLVAGCLGLRVHARAHLLHLDDDTVTLARATLLHGTLFSAFTFALLADSFASHRNLGLFSIADLFECHLERMLHGLHFLWSRLLLTPAT